MSDYYDEFLIVTKKTLKLPSTSLIKKRKKKEKIPGDVISRTENLTAPVGLDGCKILYLCIPV